MFDSLLGLAAQARTLVIAVAVVVWLGATLAMAVKRQSILSAAGVFIAGAFLVWGMSNSDLLRDRAGTDIQGSLGARNSAPTNSAPVDVNSSTAAMVPAPVVFTGGV
jgi:hypothetical protein